MLSCFRGGVVLSEKLSCGIYAARLISKTLTLFMIKSCDFPYPIYDLTRNSTPYLWPDPYINMLFHTSLIISSLVQSSVKLPAENTICEGLISVNATLLVLSIMMKK